MVCSLYWICGSDNVIWPDQYHPQRPLGAGEDPLLSPFRHLQSVCFLHLLTLITVSSVLLCLNVKLRCKPTSIKNISEPDWTEEIFVFIEKLRHRSASLFNTTYPPTPVSTKIFFLRRLGRSRSRRRGLPSPGTTASGRSWGRRKSSWRSPAKTG